MSALVCQLSPRDLAEALGGAEQRGKKWLALCPGHDDHNASLEIEAPTGTTVFWCPVCPDQRVVFKRVRETVPHAFQVNGKPSPTAQPATIPPASPPTVGSQSEPPSTTKGASSPPPWERDAEAVYLYVDETGTLLFQVVRFRDRRDPRFMQRIPRPREKWDWRAQPKPPRTGWKVRGTRQVLYRLPEIAPRTAVVLVEGEKDVDNLWSLGIAATCNPGGASKWRPEYSEALAGMRVAIIADADRAGRDHAGRVAVALHGVAVSVRVLECPDGHKDVSDWIAAGATWDDISACLRRAPEWTPSPDPPPIPVQPESKGAPTAARPSSRDVVQPDDLPPDRPTIRLVAGELPHVVDEAEAALLKTPDHGGMYQRGGQLVRIIRLEARENGALTLAAGTPMIRQVPRAALAETLTMAAAWLKYDARAKGWVAKDCPETVAATYEARSGAWKLRPLVGVVDMPTLRADGSLLHEPGYDADTGLVLLEHDMPDIPEKPTHEDAVDALRTLSWPLNSFPWAGATESERGTSRSVILAALLTTCIRPILPTAPLFAIDAPAPGTGKSLLADIVSLIATGHPAPALSQAANPEEDAKRLFAVLLQGSPLVCIDNIERDLEGDALCSILQQEIYESRVLGVTEMRQVRTTSTTFLATGNNLRIKGDLARRAILCRIDAGVERPETRHFTQDPRDQVRADRKELVAAALTVLRAYIVAGRPDQSGETYGGYEEWSRWVRGPLLWLDQADPCASRTHIRGGDEVARQLGAMLEAWTGAFGSHTMPVAAALQEADERVKLAMSDVASMRNGDIDRRRLGKWIARHEDRIIGGRRFMRGPVVNGAQSWKVDYVN